MNAKYKIFFAGVLSISTIILGVSTFQNSDWTNAESFSSRKPKPTDNEQDPYLASSPGGVLPDCSELSITYDQMISLAKNPAIKTIDDYLMALPKRSLQTFTLVHQSESPRKPDVNELWPRVIRTSTDGKLMLAYTCQPSGKTEIEIAAFDQNKRYKFVRIDLQTREVQVNHSSCMGCHSERGANDPRPNWASYQTWKGVFGEEDDQLSSSEITKLTAFKQLQANNPCYSTLPWARPNAPGYEYYPYSTAYKSSNYDVRPNLKITEVQSHLMAQRLADKFWRSPGFRKFRFGFLMDALNCAPPDFEDRLKNEFNNISFRMRSIRMPHDPRYTDAGKRLIATGRALGIPDSDWHMVFFKKADENSIAYNTGVSNVAPNRLVDINMYDLTQGQLMQLLAKEEVEFAKYAKTSKGEEESFGSRFRCIDDLGGKLILSQNEISQACADLDRRDRQAQTEAPTAPLPVAQYP